MLIHWIKNLPDAFLEFLTTYGRIRAAAELARTGHHEQARRIMELD